jgi:hypothetical protein
MRGRGSRFKLTALTMAVVMTVVSTPSGLALAGLVETEQVIAEDAGRTGRARVIDFLIREDVQAQLVGLGVDPHEAVARVAALSDAEVQAISGHLDTLPAGQVHGPIIAAAVVVFLVLLSLDLFGVTDVFPFISPIDKKARR